MDIGSMFGSGGGGSSAVSSIFGAIGDFQQAAGSRRAAKLDAQNVDISQRSTAIQEMQTVRQTYQTVAGQMSDVAGAGLKESGSAIDLLRSSQQQASLQKQLVENQGQITTNGYQAKEAADEAAAKASQTAGIGGIASGVLSIASMFSDIRLKTDIIFIGIINGYRWYSYNYVWGGDRQIGVMAQEVMQINPTAVARHPSGYLMVDYGRL